MYMYIPNQDVLTLTEFVPGGAAQLSTDQRLTSRVQGTDVDMKSNYNPYENTPKESDSTNTLITR